MKRLFLAAALLAIAGACSSKPSSDSTPPGIDLGDDGGSGGDAGAYQGPTTGGAIPPGSADAEPDPLQDATFSEDTTCCNVVFSIPADGEPTGTTGVVVGSYAPLLPPGIPLTLSGGVWSAPACVPIQVAFSYDYVFTEPVVVDAGADGDAASDAGSNDAASDAGATVVVQRYDPSKPNQPDAMGNIVNVYGAVPSCAAIDASSGTLGDGE